jgi:hypothetical protein
MLNIIERSIIKKRKSKSLLSLENNHDKDFINIPETKFSELRSSFTPSNVQLVDFLMFNGYIVIKKEFTDTPSHLHPLHFTYKKDDIIQA